MVPIWPLRSEHKLQGSKDLLLSHISTIQFTSPLTPVPFEYYMLQMTLTPKWKRKIMRNKLLINKRRSYNISKTVVYWRNWINQPWHRTFKLNLIVIKEELFNIERMNAGNTCTMLRKPFSLRKSTFHITIRKW